MSLKDLFKNNPVLDSSKITDVEGSDELLQEHSKLSNRYIPDVDYSDPKNFVRFGLASEYYKDCSTRILDYYPFDGSSKDKIEWENNCLDVDLYILKNYWPKTTGYANFSPSGWGNDVSQTGSTGFRLSDNPEYIKFKTGPNVDNYYESSSTLYRGGNFYLDSDKGTTVEFWLKKSSFASTTTAKAYVLESILHLVPVAGFSSPTHNLKLSIFTGTFATPGDSAVTPSAGYASLNFIYDNEFVNHPYANFVILDGNWHHYAVSFKYESGATISIRLYRDGILLDKNTSTLSTTYKDSYYLPYSGTIGALARAIDFHPTVPEYYTAEGYGKLTGSIDEVRIWNIRRTSEQIYKYYNFSVNGGTNTEDSNLDLGIYYKFNEGITGVSSTDSVVLDYSGRNSNGLWTGYSANSRSTGSAIVESEASTIEPLDVIIHPNHPDVVQLKSDLESSGSLYDGENVNNIYNFVPNWILRESDDTENNTTKNILQIISTALDEFHIKTEKIKELKNVEYKDNSSYKNNPFLNKMLISKDFNIYEMFLNSNLFEQINSKEEAITYNEKISNIKNFIYQNIYNNLSNIYKSKGTEKSVRNLLNCFGVNSELIKLNLYANNAQYDFGTTNYEEKITKKKYVKFSSNNYAVISSSSPDISSGKVLNETYVEVDCYFPKFVDINSTFYNPSYISESSIVTLKDVEGNADYELSFRKLYAGSKHGQFVLSSYGVQSCISEVLYDVYDNKRWLISFGKYQNSGSFYQHYSVGGAYNHLDFIHVVSDDVDKYYENQSGNDTFNNNFSVLLGKNTNQCDVDISSVRVYAKNYDRFEGLYKFKDVNNYGTLYPHKNKSVLERSYMPEEQSLMLHWAFDNVSYDGDDQPCVEDLSSGSSNIRYSNDYYGYSETLFKKFPGTGSNFGNDPIDVKYILNSQQKTPENLCGSDMIKIIDKNEYSFFRRDSRPVNYIYSLERSYFQNISQEMLNVFASITAFNNIIGEPVQRYRNEYKSLNKLRNLFYEKVGNIPDIEKYVTLYKWIDKSITDAIMNIIPASTNIIQNNEIIVESHLLERSKYRQKHYNLKDKKPNLVENLKGIGHKDYHWDNLGVNFFEYRWGKESAQRVPVFSSSLYYLKNNNIYDISADMDYRSNSKSSSVNSSITINSSDLIFRTKGIPQTASNFDWSSVSTVDYWDVYSLSLPSGTPVPQIVGGFASTILTGSRDSYSGSFYDSTYSEATNYPRSAWLDGKKCISRHANATANYATTYRFNGINPLSGSTNFTLYFVGGIYAGEAHPYFHARRTTSDGYFTPPRSFAITKNTSTPESLTYSYTTTAGSAYSSASLCETLTDLKFYLFVVSKNSLSVSVYAISEAGFKKDVVTMASETWPASDNLNFLGNGTDATSTRIAENASFTWVSLHSDSHDISNINKIINQINIKQGSNFVSVTY